MNMRLGAVALLMLWPMMAAVSDIDPNKTAGNPSAPVTVQVFSDFECPSCKVFHDRTLPQLQHDFVATGKVFLVYREFPLPMHAHSREAANYAVAAARLHMFSYLRPPRAPPPAGPPPRAGPPTPRSPRRFSFLTRRGPPRCPATSPRTNTS